MTEILKIGYGETFALTYDFDLNTLRNVYAVKKVGNAYVAEDPDNASKMEIVLNQNVITNPSSIEKSKVAELEKEKENLHRWWKEEEAARKKIGDELNCLKAQLEELTKPQTEF